MYEYVQFFLRYQGRNNKRSSAKASVGVMSPFDLQDVNMFLLMGKYYEGY